MLIFFVLGQRFSLHWLVSSDWRERERGVKMEERREGEKRNRERDRKEERRAKEGEKREVNVHVRKFKT